MHIIAIGWIFVVLLMAVSEAMVTSIIAGIMTFTLYGVLPLGVILYVMGTPGRKRKRLAAENLQREQRQGALPVTESSSATSTRSTTPSDQ